MDIQKKWVGDIAVFTELVCESADNWRAYLREMRGKQGDEIRNAHTLRITLVNRYDSRERYKFDVERCIVPYHHRYDRLYGYDTLVIPCLWDEKKKFQSKWCAWLVTEDGHDVPILYWEFNRLKLSWPWREKVPGVIKFSDMPETSCAYEDGYRLFADQDKKNPAVISLFYGSRLICDTSTEPLDVLFNFYRNIKGVRAAIHHLVMMRLEHKYADTQEKFMLLRKDMWRFFEEAISRFNETKQASRHKLFGEFRCFLDQEQERFKETFKS